MYRLKIHKNLNKKKWEKFTRGQQILMIANEINRAKNWLLKVDSIEVANCYERALELLDLTVSVVKRGNLIKELLRFREVLCEEYLKKNKSIKKHEIMLKVLISLNSESFNLLNPQ